MFNSSRAGASPMASHLLGQSNSGFVDPLASNGFSEVDPWSGTQSPVRSVSPRSDMVAAPPTGASGGPSTRQAFLTDPPPMYVAFFRQLDPSSSGMVTLQAVKALLDTSRLPPDTITKIVKLGAQGQTAVPRTDFFIMLALVALAQSHPENELSLDALDATLPSLPHPRLQAGQAAGSGTSATPRPPAQSQLSSSFSPWDSSTPYVPIPTSGSNGNGNGFEPSYQRDAGNPDAELERGFWSRMESVDVELIAEKEGWFLQKYRLSSDRREAPVSRRYSDFVWLSNTLVHRYPFRLIPALPPKKIRPDAHFLEQRRKGLQRFVTTLVNHPVIRDDGALNVFMTEPKFEAWRNRVKVSTEEESASKKLNPAQEMAIPADLEAKLDRLRARLPSLIGSYQKMVTLAERELQRLQVAAAETTRLAMSFHAVAEEMPLVCYSCVPGATNCDLCQGVGRGLGATGHSLATLAQQWDRKMATIADAVESLKTQRDLYIAFRDLFARHERLSHDAVDSLRKKVETRQNKIEVLRSSKKPGFEGEVEQLVSAIDHDNSTISTLLSRRVFIRACMWHELSVVLHTRQAAYATLGCRAWSAGLTLASKNELRVWESLSDELERMPLE